VDALELLKDMIIVARDEAKIIKAIGESNSSRLESLERKLERVSGWIDAIKIVWGVVGVGILAVGGSVLKGYFDGN